MSKWRFANIFVVAAAIATIYLTIATTENQIVAPLDDAYIHFQYARQAAQGQLWHYNTNDPISTGTSSFLYPFILTTGFLLNLPDGAVAGFAIIIGAVAFAGATCFVHDLLARFGSSSLIWVVVAAFMLTGAVHWGFFNGMETGLYALALIGALHQFANGRFRHSAVLTAIAALVRPEGTFLAAILWLAIAWRERDNIRKGQFTHFLQISAILSLALVPYLINFTLSGSPIATGAQAKSWFGNVPFRLGDILLSIGRGFVQILGRFTLGQFGAEGWPVTVAILPLTLIGWYTLWQRGYKHFVVLSSSWAFVGLLLSATLITATWQMGRYQLPYLVTLYPVMGIGLLRLGHKSRPVLRLAFPIWFVLLTLQTSFTAFDTYHQAVNTIARQQVRVGAWIEENLPPDSLVAVHDAGAIRYVGERPVLDVIGLTSQGYASLWRAGMGTVFEEMEAAEKRPTHFATYPNAFSLAYLQNTDMFSRELFRAAVPEVELSPISSAEATQIVYEVNWDKANRGNDIQHSDLNTILANQQLLSRIDVAYLPSELAAQLTWWESADPFGFPTDVQQLSSPQTPVIELLDGGRLLTGGVEFTVAHENNQPLMLVARVHNIEPNAFRVVVDGRDAGMWRLPALPGEWLETSFLIDGSVSEGTISNISLTVDRPEQYVGLYHLWVYDGGLVFPELDFETAVQANFGPTITLEGFSLNQKQYSPGDIVNLELIWEKITANDLDAKVFVHLYNDAGEIVAQHDGYPANGTRPPYNWHIGEQIPDPHTIHLPPDLAPGEYQLAVGLYNPATNERIPIDNPTPFIQSQNSLQIASIRLAGDSRPNVEGLQSTPH